MEKIDLAIIVVGIVVVSAAVAGAVLYGSGTQTTTFDVTWNIEDHEGEPQRSSLGESGGEVVIPFDVDRQNLTQVTFEVVVESQGTHVTSDDVEVTVEAPDGDESSDSTTMSVGQTSVTIEVEMDLREAPERTRVTATDREAAIMQLDQRHGSDEGTGVWNVTVTVTTGGVAGVGSGYSITVTPTYTDYHPQLTPTVGDLEGV